MRLRNTLYTILRIANDIRAIRQGKITQRVGRRVAGRIAGKAIRRIFK